MFNLQIWFTPENNLIIQIMHFETFWVKFVLYIKHTHVGFKQKSKLVKKERKKEHDMIILHILYLRAWGRPDLKQGFMLKDNTKLITKVLQYQSLANGWRTIPTDLFIVINYHQTAINPPMGFYLSIKWLN